MSIQDNYFAYQQVAAVGASPVEQVIALYDRILRDFYRCIAAIGGGEIEERVRASNHALTVVGELQGVLDFQQGGDVARNLNDFYSVTRPMIAQASIKNSVEKFQELIGMYSRIRAAWAQVAARSPQAPQPPERLRVSSVPRKLLQSGPAAIEEPSSTSRWSA
jgi:flagellar secretion chaperone FliS